MNKLDAEEMLSYHDSYNNESVTFIITEGIYKDYLLECHYNIEWDDDCAVTSPSTMYLVDLHDNSKEVTKDPYFSSQGIWFRCDQYVNQEKAYEDKLGAMADAAYDRMDN